MTPADWPWERKRLVCPHDHRGTDRDIGYCHQAVPSDRPWPEIEGSNGPVDAPASWPADSV